jgi:molybdopterin synthase sulfur carrier subunit
LDGLAAVRVLVLYFAAAKEAAGCASESMELEGGATVGSLLEIVSRARPALARLLPALRAAVGERFAPPTQVLEPGDTIALLPPASGG